VPDQTAQNTGDRPVPFMLRVAAEWMPPEEVPGPEDGALFVRSRALLTGDLALTDEGGDLQFSDVEV
jgi:hypothetical protein